MGFDDILKAGSAEEIQHEHERRQLQMTIGPKCDELRDNGKAAVDRALSSIPDLQHLGAISSIFGAPLSDDSVRRSFGVTARTTTSTLEFQVTGVVRCRVSDGRLTFEREPLQIDVAGLNFHPIRKAHATFRGVSGGTEDTSYSVDVLGFKAALKAMVRELSKCSA